MSYILEALKKSEQERELGRTAKLNSLPAVQPQRNFSYVVLWLFAIALFFLSMSLAYIYFQREQFTSLASITVKEDRAPRADTLVGELEKKVAAEKIITSPRVSAEKPSQPPVSAPIKEPKSTAVATQAIKRVPQHSDPGQDDTKTPSLPDKAILPEQGLDNTVIEPPAVAPENIPTFEELPSDIRAKLPEIPAVDVHVYSEAASERFVLLNMKRYVEGQQTIEGFRVIEILSNGVVLQYRDTTLRLSNQ